MPTVKPDSGTAHGLSEPFALLSSQARAIRECGGSASIDPYAVTFLLRATGRLPQERVRAAAHALQERHDALRSRLVGPEHDIRQVVIAAGREAPPVDVVHIPLAAGSAVEDEIAKLCSSAVNELSVRNGPTWRVIQVSSSTDDYLLFLVSHLFVDNASMVLLLREFQSFYHAADASSWRPSRTPSRLLQLHAHTMARPCPVLPAELPWWRSRPWQDITLRSAFGDTASNHPDLETHRTVDGDRWKAATSALAADGITPEHIVLSTIAAAVARQEGRATVRLDVCGHGRYQDHHGHDVRRLAGWMATVTPYLLEVPDSGMDDPGPLLEKIATQIEEAKAHSRHWDCVRPSLPEQMAESPGTFVNFTGDTSWRKLVRAPFALAGRQPAQGSPPVRRTGTHTLRVQVSMSADLDFRWRSRIAAAERLRLEQVADDTAELLHRTLGGKAV
ncbi:condensation domain-containing protein [Streptomyces hygroscopicus]|uniref:condensation domain-containing protein n=1 Tax=Streptomyces hygroscopicus TaxID=1912 RepID=UPI0036CAA175